MEHPSYDLVNDMAKIFALKQDTDALTNLLHAVSLLVQEEASIIVPVADVYLTDNTNIQLISQQMADGQEYITAFTSADAQKASKSLSPSLNRSWRSFLEAVLFMDNVAGVMLNPGTPAAFIIQNVMLKGILENATANKHKNAIRVWQGDITTLECDVIVNAANSSLLGGGGVDGAIHRAAGLQLLAECRELKGCAVGEAKITFGYNLPATHVIHTVGPIYTVGGVYNNTLKLRQDLANAYHNSLELAKKHHLHSIAFPAISTGVYSYPIEEACRIALLTITQWLNANPTYGMEVTLACFNREVLSTYKELMK